MPLNASCRLSGRRSDARLAAGNHRRRIVRRVLHSLPSRAGAGVSAPETGESTASIIARGDDADWPHVKAALEAGATLLRPSRLDRYYVARDLAIGSRSLSKTRVKRLEREGVLVHVGVDRYALAAAPVADSGGAP